MAVAHSKRYVTVSKLREIWANHGNRMRLVLGRTSCSLTDRLGPSSKTRRRKRGGKRLL